MISDTLEGIISYHMIDKINYDFYLCLIAAIFSNLKIKIILITKFCARISFITKWHTRL